MENVIKNYYTRKRANMREKREQNELNGMKEMVEIEYGDKVYILVGRYAVAAFPLDTKVSEILEHINNIIALTAEYRKLSK